MRESPRGTDPTQLPTLFEAWYDANMMMANLPDGEGVFMPMLAVQDLTMEAWGFGLPEDNVFLLGVDGTPDKRVKLLEKRYVYPDLWEHCMDTIRSSPRLTNAPRTSRTAKNLNKTRTKPSKLASQSILLFRPGNYQDGTAPDGGGCLISIILTRFDKYNGIHVFSRASEIGKALLGDLYFVRHLVRRAIAETGLEGWEEENLHIRWTAVQATQRTYFTPTVLQTYGGDQAVYDFYAKPEKTRWDRFLKRYFWVDTLNPERIKWPPRRRYAEIFNENATFDWHQIGEEEGWFEVWRKS